MKYFGTVTQLGAVVAEIIGLCACLPALAQDVAPPSPPKGTSVAATIPLSHALQRFCKETGLTVVADSTVSYERVPVERVPIQTASGAPVLSEAEYEKKLATLVQTLPPGTIWGKLYLPLPPAGRTWKGDDIAAFAFAQARLFGKVGTPTSDGSIEILGRRVGKDAAPPYITGLNLKPVYLITNTRRQIGEENARPWSTASPEQWANMSREERTRYGQQQATWIMSLPQEQRDQMLERIRQHDKYFDTVKDPLEKLLGHDL